MATWKLIDDSGVDYAFIRAFRPWIADGEWLGAVVHGADEPNEIGLLTVEHPGGIGTFTAPVERFERLD